jgi:hypothetical protein
MLSFANPPPSWVPDLPPFGPWPFEGIVSNRKSDDVLASLLARPDDVRVNRRNFIALFRMTLTLTVGWASRVDHYLAGRNGKILTDLKWWTGIRAP